MDYGSEKTCLNFGSDLEHILVTIWQYVPPHCVCWALHRTGHCGSAAVPAERSILTSITYMRAWHCANFCLAWQRYVLYQVPSGEIDVVWTVTFWSFSNLWYMFYIPDCLMLLVGEKWEKKMSDL